MHIESEDATALDVDALRSSLEEAAKLRLDVEIVEPGTIGGGGGRVVDERET